MYLPSPMAEPEVFLAAISLSARMAQGHSATGSNGTVPAISGHPAIGPQRTAPIPADGIVLGRTIGSCLGGVVDFAMRPTHGETRTALQERSDHENPRDRGWRSKDHPLTIGPASSGFLSIPNSCQNR